MMKEIAERLRGLRDSLDISSDEMAEKTGIDKELYAAYETGNADIPMNYLCKVAQTYGIDTAVLISGDETHAQSYFVLKGSWYICRAKQSLQIQRSCRRFKNAKTTPFLVTVEPNNNPIHLNTHEGQEFNMVEKVVCYYK